MKKVKQILTFVVISFFLVMCKPDVNPEEVNKKSNKDIDTVFTDTIKNIKTDYEEKSIKIVPIKISKDDSDLINTFLKSKEYYKRTDTYIIDFCYPYLSEKYNPKFETFNNYVKDELLKLQEVERDILETQELLCDTLNTKKRVAHRIAEYKVYLQNEEHVSVLFYLENHYTATKSAYYTFKTLNFDKIKGELLNFEDYFIEGSIEEVLEILNTRIDIEIKKGDLFYECFKVSVEDFREAKNDFVINNNSVIYYFNDCVMCPSFVGTYKIEIPLENLKSVLKNSWTDRFKK